MIGLVQRLHAAELVRILGRLLDHGIEHVIHRDDAQQLLPGIHHRQCKEVMTADQARHFFLVCARFHRDGRIDLGHAEYRRVRRPHDQPAHCHHAQQYLCLRIERIDGIDRLAYRLDLADMLQGPAHGPVRRNRNELGRHQGTGGTVRVIEQQLDRLARFGLDHRQQPGLRLLAQFAHDVGGPVIRHQPEQHRRPFGREQGNELTGVVQLGRFEQPHRTRQWQHRERRGGLRHFQRIEIGHRICGIEPGQGCGQSGDVSHRAQQLLLVHLSFHIRLVRMPALCKPLLRESTLHDFALALITRLNLLCPPPWIESGPSSPGQFSSLPSADCSFRIFRQAPWCSGRVRSRSASHS
jgi:hypothetical protein